MAEFPRTTVGGVSLPRLLIGSNWFQGFSHRTVAKDKLICEIQTPEHIAEILTVFFEHGIDAVLGMPQPALQEAMKIAEDRTGHKGILIVTPGFELTPDGPAPGSAARAFAECAEHGATFCFPHTSVTDCLLDMLTGEIRHYDRLAKLIREREMIPGLSTHMPESVGFADKAGADVESYIQIFNAVGFLMRIEVDWEMQVIRNAKKPVMTIKPFAAGRLDPTVGLTFSWNAIREQDMVAVGTLTPDEAKEVIETSLKILERRLPDHELQRTRSKATLG